MSAGTIVHSILIFSLLCCAEAEPKTPAEPLTEADYTALREGMLNKLRAEDAERERTPEYIEEQKKREAAREKAIETIRKDPLLIRARVHTVARQAILATISIRKPLAKRKGDTKTRFSVSDELEEAFWIEGVDTSDLVDNDVLDLTVYVAGKYSYTAVNGAHKTVRRLATSPELTLHFLLKRQ